jgi:hypothetical protein
MTAVAGEELHDESPERGLHWKTKFLAERAGGCPFICSPTRLPTPISGGSAPMTKELPLWGAITQPSL